MMARIDRVLAEARSRIDRVSPHGAAAALRNGAVLVDIRPIENRRDEGLVPGALVVDRNVLEWRLDPTSPDRLADCDRDDRVVIVMCNDGYASSLAAAGLRDLGLHRAADMVGGYRAWHVAGLPTRRFDAAHPSVATAEPVLPPALLAKEQ